MLNLYCWQVSDHETLPAARCDVAPMLFHEQTESWRAALVGRTLDPKATKTRARRKAVADRVACVEERPEELAKERLRATFNDANIAAEVCRFASPVWNPFANLTARIAQGYAHPPIRRIPKAPEAEAALLEFLEGPTRFNQRAKAWNFKAVAYNTIVVLVVPKRRRGKPCFDFRVIHGAAAEVVQDPDVPFGDTPLMLAYCLQRPEERQSKAAGDEPVVCVVDGHAYHYVNAKGRIVRSDEHQLGRFPGAVLRSVDPDGNDDDDWWCWRHNQTLIAGNATIGAIGAICEWGRKTQWGRLVTVTRDAEAEAEAEVSEEEGQTVGMPESVLEAAGAAIKVEDFEAPVEGFLKHQAAILHEVARRTTGSSRILDDQQLMGDELAQRHAVLLGLQREQHGFLGPFERDLLEVMAEVAARAGIEGFPRPEDLASYDVTFVPLTYVSTPEARLRWYIDATRYGVSDQVLYLQEQGWSEADAVVYLQAIAKRRAELHLIQSTHNQPADPTAGQAGQDPALPGERPEAHTGREGGIASGALRTAA
ncbi:MAG: hypothetical protein KC501_24990 [Myxococcales bacterium]|nr:hypothetical protein [Myxococcales bacterium]